MYLYVLVGLLGMLSIVCVLAVLLPVLSARFRGVTVPNVCHRSWSISMDVLIRVPLLISKLVGLVKRVPIVSAVWMHPLVCNVNRDSMPTMEYVIQDALQLLLFQIYPQTHVVNVTNLA